MPWTLSVANAVGELRVVGDDRTAVADAAQVLGRVEAVRGGNGAPGVVQRSVCLRGVFDDQ